jgi:hypothetical protein
MAAAQKSSNPASDESNLVPFEKAVEVKLVEGTNDTFSASAASASPSSSMHTSPQLIPPEANLTLSMSPRNSYPPSLPAPSPSKLSPRSWAATVRASLRTATTTCTVAFVTQGNLATESGPNFETPKFELPDRAKCREMISKVFGTANPATKRCRIFCPPGGETPFWTLDLGWHRRDQWARLTDVDSWWDLLSLACIADWVR